MKRVAWVTGAGGFLGSYLVREAARHAPEVDVIGLRRPELDLSDEATVEKRFLADRPEAVAAARRAGLDAYLFRGAAGLRSVCLDLTVPV